MVAQLEPGLMATDLADYLVKKGIPFREAHGIVGKVVQQAETQGVAISDLSLDQLRAIDGRFEADVTGVFSVTAVLANRTVTGGTAPAALLNQLDAARQAAGHAY
jgi:argininosuccinate lyase